MRAKALLFLLVAALFVGPAPALADEPQTLSAIDPKYDPAKDVLSPSEARWLYLGSLWPEASAWSAGLNGCFGFDFFDRRSTAVQLLVTPSSFFGFLWATRHRQVTMGMVSTTWNGTWQGYGAGFLVGDVLFDWGQEIRGFEPRLGTAVAGSVTGHIIGLRHGEHERLNYGNAEMLSQAGLWSALYSGYVMALPLPWGGTLYSESGAPWRRKLVQVAALTGWYYGLRMWDSLAPRDYTTGDAISTWNSNVMSGLTAAAAGSLLPDDVWDSEWAAKGASLLPAAVNAGGFLYGYRFHRRRDVTLNQSLLVTLGTTLGASSIGTAVAILATPEGKAVDGRLTLVTVAAGGWLGFHLTHMLLDTDKPAMQKSTSRGVPLRVTLMPGNALGVLLAAKTRTECRVPLLHAEF